MNRSLLFLILLLPLGTMAQTRPGDTSFVSLASYVPTQYFQYKGTCFAYAVTYTALSIEYNYAHQVTDNEQINANAFSGTFTASMVRKQKPLYKKIFTLWSCNIGGNITEAADVLKKYGAVRARVFPQCCTTNLDKPIKEAANFQIEGYTELIPLNSGQSPLQEISKIKAALKAHHPVICAINQSTTLMNEHDYYVTIPDHVDDALDKSKSNHAICVIGYSDAINKGSFLIKNNYANFGMEGMAWIRYTDFQKYFCYAIQLMPGTKITGQ